MKAACLLALALCPLSSASPRINQISPATGIINGDPVAYDLDQDGDLDIAYLNNGAVGNNTPASSTWLENLGSRTFSAPRSLGHSFFSNQRLSLSETLITSPNSNTATLLHLTSSSPTQSIELSSKKIDSPSWQVIHRFPSDHLVSFLKSPHPDLPLIFSKELSSDLVTYWLAQPDSISEAGQFPLPPVIGHDNNTPYNFQAADFDQDGDLDLLLESQNQTLIYEQTSPLNFSQIPISLNLTSASIGDLNLDGRPDLFNNSTQREVSLNEGNFIFSESSLGTISSSPSSTFVGQLDALPILIDLFPRSTSAPIKVSQLSPDFSNLTEIPFETNSLTSLNPSGLLVADFDQDGRSDVTFISRSSPAPQSIFTGVRSPNDFIPGLPGIGISSAPLYDQVIISWGQPNSFTTPGPASDVAPIICDAPAVGDFNNDGFLDLIVGPDINGQARILLNNGQGDFPSSRILTELQFNNLPFGDYSIDSYLPVDLDGDGNLDLSFTVNRVSHSLNFNSVESACTIAMGDGQGGFTSLPLPAGSFQSITNGFCGIREFRDFDNDGDLDAILPGAWRENINGTLRQSAYPLIQNIATTDVLGNPINVVSQRIADLDGDGFLDVLIPALNRTPFDPFTSNLINFGSDPFNPGVAFNTGNGGVQNISDFTANLLITDALGNPLVMPYLALDLNLDGRAEILTSEPATDALGNPIVSRITCRKLDPTSARDLSLAQVISYPAFSLPLTDQLLDFNGDGELEYVAADQFITPTSRGPLISPKYNFKGDHLSNFYPALEAIAVHDFDNDGDADALYADNFSGLHLVRNTIVDEDSLITTFLMSLGLTPAQASPEADPDNDGRPNYLELLQGTNFTTYDQAPADFLAISFSPDGQYLHHLSRKNAADLSLYYDLEVSNDLVNWTRTSAPTTLQTAAGLWDNVSVEIPRDARKKFYRISATHDPRR